MERLRSRTENLEERRLEALAKLFDDVNIPLKIRKIKLIKEVGLPMPKTDYFDVKELRSLKTKIIERLQYDESLVVRVACIPDKLSMPVFHMETRGDLTETIAKIRDLIKVDPSIKYLILRNTISREKIKDRVAGRFSLESSAMAPNDQFLDIYKGARSIDILDTVKEDDPNFQRFVKKTGGFMSPEKLLDHSSDIKESELREIYSLLQRYTSRLELIRRVIALSRDKSVDQTTTCFEFSFIENNLVFTDFD